MPRLYLTVVFWIKGDYLLPLQPVATGVELTLGKVVAGMSTEQIVANLCWRSLSTCCQRDSEMRRATIWIGVMGNYAAYVLDRVRSLVSVTVALILVLCARLAVEVL